MTYLSVNKLIYAFRFRVSCDVFVGGSDCKFDDLEIIRNMVIVALLVLCQTSAPRLQDPTMKPKLYFDQKMSEKGV